MKMKMKTDKTVSVKMMKDGTKMPIGNMQPKKMFGKMMASKKGK